ncbi:glycosyltransferase family 4 protein [Pseudomonas shirazensis]|uniref:glycosyltransferase family 4 protein n=1 Tax=Pseudomonas shirazensis TaxID=2745494 RepID=UPI003D083199
MRIVIDMQGAQTESRFRGIGRYSVSLAQGIVRNRGEHEVFLVLNGMLSEGIEAIRAAFVGLLPQSHIRVWYAQGPVAGIDPSNNSRNEVAKQIRQACIDELQPDVVHITSAVEGFIDDAVIGNPSLDKRAIVSATLYDLIPLTNPAQYLDHAGYKQYYMGIVGAFKDHGVLLAISECARQEALSLLPLEQDRVVNVSTAADEIFRPVDLTDAERVTLKSKFGLHDAFVLYSGGADERKNLSRLIVAFAKVKQQVADIQLVFAGKMSQHIVERYRAEALAQDLCETDLVFTGFITDDELVALYNTCRLYVFPSWHEGFGLPPLEAMKCGAPVIGANTSSVPEVIGWEEALFDPLDTGSIAQKMHQALVDDQFRATMTSRGLERAKLFSWDLTGKAAVEAFEQALLNRGEPGRPVDEDQPTKLRIDMLANTLATSGHLSDGGIDISRLSKAIDYSLQGPKGTPKLLVDISQLCRHDGKSGIQRVVRSILLEWLTNPPEGYIVTPVYAKVEESFYRNAARFTAQFLGKDPKDEDVDEAISYQAGDTYICLDLLLDVLPQKQPYLDRMRAHGVNMFFVVYDLLILQMRHFFSDHLHQHYVNWINAIARYDGAICISRAVADELQAWMDANGPKRQRPFRIGVFHLGADLDQSLPSTGIPEDPSMRIEALQSNPSFLMVGTLEPRKGHAQALEAFELLWQQGVQANLIIVGKHGWLVDELAAKLANHPERGNRLLWLEGASDEYLEHLYQQADCLIAASYGEGFGLPLIEAAQHKLPIIARDLPVFREVAGEHAWFFAGTDARNVADSIAAWLELHAHNEHPKSGDMPWLTWKGSAQQLLGEITKHAF